VLVVPGRRGPCLRCLFPALPPPGSTPTCRTAGILAPVTGVVGSLQVAAVLRLLLGVSDDAGRFVAVDLKEGGTRMLRFERDPRCPACGDERTVRGQRDADYAMAGVCAGEVGAGEVGDDDDGADG
jgi:adenylyltransferase/sulfurtransferase